MMKAGVAVVVAVVGLGYLAYEPFPSDLEDPWKVRFMSWSVRLIAAASSFSAFVGYHQSPMVGLRNIMNSLMKPSSLEDDDLQIFDTTFDSVKVRVYKPKKAKGLLPGIVYLHGGGFVLFSVDTYDGVTRDLAVKSNVVVASVDYRLAPEHPFPTPLEDCLVAVKHFLKNAKQYGADPTKVGVAGDSAGGNLAAAVSQRLLREKPKSLEKLKFQVLIYPTVQAINFNLPSMRHHPEYTTPLLKTRHLPIFWLLHNNVSLSYFGAVEANRHVSKKLRMSKYYTYVSTDLLPDKYRQPDDKLEILVDEPLSQSVEKLLINSDISPLMATDLSGLPPSLVITTEYDPLRDEGLMYGKRLKDAGVKVRLHHERYSFHGFFSQSAFKFKALDRSIDEITNLVKENV